ncbi:MAG: hydroxymethylbilane synthase [Bacteroidetes bacterium]|nr:hydroxymethylbilane synthase [Bacteroidota bacterium]
MSKKNIRIGTRGSQLALFQANEVKKHLENAFHDTLIETKVIKTKGDKIVDVALSKIGDKGLFTKELEVALTNGEVDMVVHSLKDLQTELEPGFEIGAVLDRADCRDALISRNHIKLNELTPEHTIATSSLRRKAGLLNINRRFNIVDIRGNVNTRLRKMEEGHCDAMIMAAAGIKRLGLDNYITEILEPSIFMPAVSQGIIAIEINAGDAETKEILNALHHEDTWIAACAERSFMRTLMGGCQVPVGCYTELQNEQFTIHGFVASLEGHQYIQDTFSGERTKANDLAIALAESLLARGGAEILDEIRT